MVLLVGLPVENWWAQPVNRVAEFQYHLRHRLLQALDAMQFTDAALRFAAGHATYGSMWRAQSGPEFLDMSTLVRLATTVESLARDYYRVLQNLPSGAGLGVDRGVFQRLTPWSQNGLVELYVRDLGYDLSSNAFLPRVQELMVHRHLYAHTSGLMTDEYLANWKRLTGEDLARDPALANYPGEDVYWFRPLNQLDALIEDVRGFFREFPTS